jgi:copper transport protein
VQTVSTDTRYGKLWLIRIGLLVAYAAALIVAAWWWPRRRPWRTTATLLVALALPLPISFDAHASAESVGRASAIATDYVHLLAASIWIGGLFLLIGALVPSLRDLTPMGRRVVLSRTLPRFSTMALTSWGVLIITGAYQAWLEVGNLDGLRHTSYGRTLLIKLIILVPLLALAAFNLIVVTRKIRESQDPESTVAWSRRFRYAIGGEVLLVVLVLLVVGRLTSLPPARGVLATETTPIELPLAANGKAATLTITPGAAGPNEYTLTLDSWSPPDGSEALLRLTYTAQDIGEKEVKLTSAGGNFEGSGSEFSIAGDWRIDAIVRKIGEFQWQASTQSAIPAQPAPAAQPRPAWHFGLGGLIGLALLVIGVAGLVYAWSTGRSRFRLEVAGIAACALLAGALLLIGARTTLTSTSASTRVEEHEHDGSGLLLR